MNADLVVGCALEGDFAEGARSFYDRVLAAVVVDAVVVAR